MAEYSKDELLAHIAATWVGNLSCKHETQGLGSLSSCGAAVFTYHRSRNYDEDLTRVSPEVADVLWDRTESYCPHLIKNSLGNVV